MPFLAPILALFGGGSRLPWIAAGLAAVLAGFLYLRLDAATARADAERLRADMAALALAELRENEERNARIADALDAATKKIEAGSVRVEREVIRVPVTTACVAAPAVRAGLAGLRRELSAPGGDQAAPGR